MPFARTTLQGLQKLGKRKDRDVFHVCQQIRVYQAAPVLASKAALDEC